MKKSAANEFGSADVFTNNSPTANGSAADSKPRSVRWAEANVGQDDRDALQSVGSMTEGAVDDLIFELFKDTNRDRLSVNTFLQQLFACGLRKDDPRIEDMMGKLYEMDAERVLDPDSFNISHLELDRESFKLCLMQSASLVTKALQGELVIPEWATFCSKVGEIFKECKSIDEGQVASYIPQLSRADPHHWAVAICTVDGQRASWGDATVPFCLQSVSKPFNYAIVHTELGQDKLHQYVGQEPSGRLFNEICLDYSNKPHNPLINAGAIVVCSLLKHEEKMADRFDFALHQYSRFAGNGYITSDNATLLSEKETADRNYALSYYMKEHKCFPAGTDINKTLELYFQLCSIQTNCDTAAVMAATLANGGICPLTDDRIIGHNACRDTLSLMYSCGMYDYSGMFAFKSGVSGAMILVIPNVMGLCLFSPPLDKLGNTIKGVRFCEKFISTFNFHNYDNLLHFENQKIDPRKRLVDVRGEKIVTLMFAAKTGDLSAVRRHRNSGGYLDADDYDGRRALHLAAAEGHAHIVKYLLDHKADPTARDRWDRSPLDEARNFARATCIELLEAAVAKKTLSQYAGD